MRPHRRLCVFLVAALCLAGTSVARGDEKVLALVAGGGDGADGSTAATAKLRQPFGIAIDSKGNLYIPEYAGHTVRRIDGKTGVITTVAGTGVKGYGGDGGAATRAQLNEPHCVVIGPNDDLYIADTANHSCRRVDAKTGVITTFAGDGKKGFTGDGGPATRAEFDHLYSIVFDKAMKTMIIADTTNRRVRAIDLATGTVRTVAGNGKAGVPENGAIAIDAPLVDPRAATIDHDGNIYILERGGHALRVLDTAGKIKTVAGTSKQGYAPGDKNALDAQMNGPKYVCVDRDNTVLIADTENHVVRRYDPKAGTLIDFAGTGKVGAGALNHKPTDTALNKPHGVYVNPTNGDTYIADSLNNRVLKLVNAKQ